MLKARGFILTLALLALTACSEDPAPPAPVEEDTPPTETTQTPTPNDQTCVYDPGVSSSFFPRWGGLSSSSDHPGLKACGSGNFTTYLDQPQVFDNKDGTITAVSAMASSEQPGNMLRNTDISFKVPAEGWTFFNHFGVFPAFDEGSLDRIGGVAFRNSLSLEVISQECSNPYVTATIPGGLKGDRWYRAHSQIRKISEYQLEVKLRLYDLEDNSALASIDSIVDCVPSWYQKDSAKWLFGTTSLTFSGVDPMVKTNVADFVGRAQ